jgi:hypothetical protein
VWTENVTWLSNEEGKKERMEVRQLAILMVLDWAPTRALDNGDSTWSS